MNAAVRRAAVLGSPISHSLSPVLHLAAYRALGLTGWSYDRIECDEARLPGLLAETSDQVIGYSCTMPLKRVVLRVADRVSEQAAAIGAGNTLIRGEDGSWFADNTDWIGIRDALADAAIDPSGSVVLLGAGGTAQAALAALAGSSSVTVLVRDPRRAAELNSTAERLGRPIRVELLDRVEQLQAADLVVNTLPGHAADPIANLPWRADQQLLDVVYDPWPTALAAAVGRAGGRVAGGADVLLFQAAAQVELMTGRAAPVPAMRAALAEASEPTRH